MTLNRRRASLLLLATLSASFLFPLSAHAADGDAVAAQAVVQAFHEALRTGDVAAVQRLLAPDAVILENGHEESREDYLRGHLAADIEFARAVPSRLVAISVTRSGATAWVRSTSHSEGRYRDRDLKLAGAELMVLTRGRSGWQIRAIHWSSRPL